MLLAEYIGFMSATPKTARPFFQEDAFEKLDPEHDGELANGNTHRCAISR
jgi:hypothetical protein